MKYTISNKTINDHKLYFTAKKDEVFCFFTKWDNHIELDLPTNKTVENVTMLGHEGTIKWEIAKGNKIKIEIPRLTIDEIPSKFAWCLKLSFSE